jgi:hypothetical protein
MSLKNLLYVKLMERKRVKGENSIQDGKTIIGEVTDLTSKGKKRSHSTRKSPIKKEKWGKE